MLPAPFDVLEATLGPAARVVRLDGDGVATSGVVDRPFAGGVRVVRTVDRADHARGNAVHHPTPLSADALTAAVADLDRRFPAGRARLVVPWTPEMAGALPDHLRPSVVAVLHRDARAGPDPPRADLAVAAPGDDRAWHGITVLHRHAGPPGEDRARGGHDDRLRWWVAGLRQLVTEGRARVLRAVRFGTPVGVGVLHWAPGAAVGPDHAGLAVVADLVVHPAHRGIGVATTLSEALVDAHLADFPRACVMGVAERPGPTPPADPPPGWRRHADLLALTREHPSQRP